MIIFHEEEESANAHFQQRDVVENQPTTSLVGSRDGILIQLNGISSSPSLLVTPTPRVQPQEQQQHQQHYYPFLDPPSAQLKSLIPQVTGFFSFLICAYVLYRSSSLTSSSIVRTTTAQQQRGTLYQPPFPGTCDRLLVALSLAELVSSFMYMIGQQAFPVEPPLGTDPEWYHATIPFAAGSTATCSAQVRMRKGEGISMISNHCPY
jgi:hypothetical protein